MRPSEADGKIKCSALSDQARSLIGSINIALEGFPAKACPGLDPGWTPVRVKKTRQTREIEPAFRFDRNGKERLCGGQARDAATGRPAAFSFASIAQGFLQRGHEHRGAGRLRQQDLIVEFRRKTIPGNRGQEQEWRGSRT
jgi:hypothetical protein